MVLSKGLAVNLHGLIIEQLGLGVIAHQFVKPRQVVQALSKIRMVFSKGRAPNLHGLFMKRLGLGVVTH